MSLSLTRCRAGCAGDLVDAVVLEPRVRQVFDLPEVALSVTEHVAERRRCACSHESTASFPNGVSAPVQYGPRVRALGLYLVAYQHLPYARAAELLGDWIGAPVSTGTLAAFIAQGAENLEEFLEEIHARVIASPVVHFDETGARADGRLRWLFCASTETATLRRGSPTRQVGSDRRERLERPAGDVCLRAGRPVPGRVVLVDDVATTGATLAACAAALRAARDQQ